MIDDAIQRAAEYGYQNWDVLGAGGSGTVMGFLLRHFGPQLLVLGNTLLEVPIALLRWCLRKIRKDIENGEPPK